MIDQFSGSHAFLSNFYAAPVKLLGRAYATVEHAFQAAKAEPGDKKGRTRIRQTQTAGAAKWIGKRIKMRSDWEGMKESVMREFLLQKFEPGSECACLLDETGDANLVEGNRWHDNYWGTCRCERCDDAGFNVLGEMLMKIREENRRR